MLELMPDGLIEETNDFLNDSISIVNVGQMVCVWYYENLGKTALEILVLSYDEVSTFRPDPVSISKSKGYRKREVRVPE